jgi:hypothetical protein
MNTNNGFESQQRLGHTALMAMAKAARQESAAVWIAV